MQYLDASHDEGFGAALDRIEPGSMDYFNERNEGSVVPGIARLAGECRRRGVAVVYILVGSDYQDLRDMPPRHRQWIRMIEERSSVRDILWSGNDAYRVREELPPQPQDTIVQKTAFGAFTSSTIQPVLQSMGRDTLIVTGVATNCCVSTTVRDAADLGYQCVLVEECTADYDQVTHDTAVRGLYFNFARVALTVDDVVEAIDRQLPV